MMNTIIAFLMFLNLLLPTDLTYARIGSDAVLYDFKDGAYVEVTVLPPTFYVAVLNENEDGYNLVSYMDVTGFMKADAMEKVGFTPKTKYADCAFSVSNDGQGANLRSSPVRGDNVIVVMPSGSGGKIVGTAAGDELISGAGESWYYVRYENGSNVTFGYVYGAHVAAEAFGEGSDESLPPHENDTTEEREQPVFELSPPLQIVLIVSLCLPVVLCVFMLRKKRKPTATDDAPTPDEKS